MCAVLMLTQLKRKNGIYFFNEVVFVIWILVMIICVKGEREKINGRRFVIIVKTNVYFKLIRSYSPKHKRL
jgi:hypothetical protein